jgi:hypothetical protein
MCAENPLPAIKGFQPACRLSKEIATNEKKAGGGKGCFLIGKESSSLKTAVTAYKRFINVYEGRLRDGSSHRPR